MKKPEISLPLCPFCGEQLMFIAKTCGYFNEEMKFDVECQVEGCYLQHGADWYLTKEELLSKLHVNNKVST